ncbi:zeta-crystallin [Xylariaceae sp. FL1651]|nr:zeta-crystallin [Xylariaceae sp. FL1651]
MKAVVIDHFVERYDEVQVFEVPVPNPQEDEILIQVKAAGVNFVDTLYARGKHQNNRRHVKPAFTLGLEFSGIVLSSPASSAFKPGDRVFGDYSGSYAEYITVSSKSSLHRIPSGWTFKDAAGLAATLPVSYGALEQCDKFRKGENVLVHAAAGGLGLAAVQIAKAAGCRVIGTAGSEYKCRVAERYGADACINYQTEAEWWGKVLRLTEGKGADVVFDSVGLVDRSLKCLAHRGCILVVGFAGREGDMEGVKANRILLKQARIIGYRFGETCRRYPEEKDQIWKELYQMIKKGTLRPTVFEKEYKGLQSVPEALADIASRKVWGKAVIQVDTGPTNEQNVAAKL